MPKLANLSQRCSAITTFSLFVMFILSILNFYVFSHDFGMDPQVESFKILSVPVFRVNSYYKWDQATILMSLHTNALASYTPNLKHLYFFISASFTEPKKNFKSQQIIYDQIIMVYSNSTEKDLQIHKDSFQTRYPLRDIHTALRKTEITLNLYCIYVPYYGIEKKKMFYELKYTMPENYNFKSLSEYENKTEST